MNNITLDNNILIVEEVDLLIKHPSQCFWKWYCGDRGLGRKIDDKKILEEIKR